MTFIPTPGPSTILSFHSGSILKKTPEPPGIFIRSGEWDLNSQIDAKFTLYRRRVLETRRSPPCVADATGCPLHDGLPGSQGKPYIPGTVPHSGHCSDNHHNSDELREGQERDRPC